MGQFVVDGKIYKTGRKKGAYSSYLKLGKITGLKILHKKKVSFKTPDQLKKSGHWRKAVAEFNLLVQAQKTGLTPKVYDIIFVQEVETGHWFPAISMEHISGVPLHKWFRKSPRKKYSLNGKNYLAMDLRNALEKFIRIKSRIQHRDLHFGNIIVSENGPKVIDFGLAHRV